MRQTKNMVQRFEKILLKKLSKGLYDKLILSTSEFNQLISYEFDNEEELTLAKNSLFCDERERRLFRRDLIIEVDKKKYYYRFNDKKSLLYLSIVDNGDLLLNCLYRYDTSTMEMDLEVITGYKFMENIAQQVVKKLTAIPFANTNGQASSNMMENALTGELKKLAQEAIDLLVGVAHHVLTYKEVRTIKPKKDSPSTVEKPVQRKQNQNYPNKPRILTLTKDEKTSQCFFMGCSWTLERIQK